MTRTFTRIFTCCMAMAVLFLWNPTDVKAQFTEDFETFVNGGPPYANGWTDGVGTGGAWSADDNGTSSSGTGPNDDHTLGVGGGGKYMYTETSGGTAGNDFLLISPAIDLSFTLTPRLEFWYHMAGNGMGELHVDLDDGTGFAANLDIMPALICNQQAGIADDWLKATVDLTAWQGSMVNIRFRGINGPAGACTGFTFESDMAIDDVKVFDPSGPDISVDAFSIDIPCGGDAAALVTITVTNQSTTDVAAGDAEATFVSTAGPVASGPVTEALPMILGGQTITFNFVATADASVVGAYSFDGTADFTAASGLVDENPGDNITTINPDVVASFGAIDGMNPDYMESFEAGNGDWVTTNAGGNATGIMLGTPGTAPLDGTQAWFHTGGAYNANELVFFESGCFDMSCMATATFSIDINYDSEATWDGASIGYNTDGSSNYTILGVEDGAGGGTSDGTGVNWYNDNDVDGIANEIDGWSGTGPGWQTASHGIDFLAGEPEVRFAVIFGSDGSVQAGAGFMWDNVKITGATTDSACFGCTDATACNYDATANYDDASCEYTSCTGCTDSNACNYDSTATIDDSSCDYSCLGCTDMAACNYDGSATIDDGSCIYGNCGDGVCDPTCGEDATNCPADCSGAVLGCTNMTACNYDPAATVDDGSCDLTSCLGCTDMTACNYDPTALIDDGSCILGFCGNGICEPICGENPTNCNDCLIRLGCTDPTAHNYSPRANTPDPANPCETCTDNMMNGDEEGVDCGGTNPNCPPCGSGCTDPAAHNYSAAAILDDGSCETCSDGIQNGDETGVDCGGVNANCGPCYDVCGDAASIACGDLLSGDTSGNTAVDLPATCGFGLIGPGAGVWYTFDGMNGSVTISTDHLGTNGFDTNLQLFSGNCTSLVCVDGNEDGGGIYTNGWTSDLSTPTSAGTTYYIYLSGYLGAQGAYEISLDCYDPIAITQGGVLPIPNSGPGTGAIDVTVTGGNTSCGPLVLSWTGPGGYTASTEDINDITMAGLYTLTVTDCAGATATITVNVPNQGRGGRGRKAAVVTPAELTATPNPFANQTMISFEVGTEETVSLEVFDIRGAKVADLFNDTAEAGQNYQVQFGKEMPAGTYIAKLTTTNGEVQHIKLILAK